MTSSSIATKITAIHALSAFTTGIRIKATHTQLATCLIGASLAKT